MGSLLFGGVDDEALYAHQMMPEERPAEMGFGLPAEAPEDATRLDRLAAFYGREV